MATYTKEQLLNMSDEELLRVQKESTQPTTRIEASARASLFVVVNFVHPVGAAACWKSITVS